MFTAKQYQQKLYAEMILFADKIVTKYFYWKLINKPTIVGKPLVKTLLDSANFVKMFVLLTCRSLLINMWKNI